MRGNLQKAKKRKKGKKKKKRKVKESLSMLILRGIIIKGTCLGNWLNNNI